MLGFPDREDVFSDMPALCPGPWAQPKEQIVRWNLSMGYSVRLQRAKAGIPVKSSAQFRRSYAIVCGDSFDDNDVCGQAGGHCFGGDKSSGCLCNVHAETAIQGCSTRY